MNNPARQSDYFDKVWTNLDITHRCLLQCPRCSRQNHKGMHKRGSDVSLNDFEKISKCFKNLHFCGQMGDPIYHPKFLDILKIAVKNNNNMHIATNGHGKKDDWWDHAFFLTKDRNTRWVFGLDGLPKDSHKYRVNQDGNLVWKQMKNGAKNGNEIMWQYIVFSYNENDIEEAKSMAEDNNIIFRLIESSRWRGEDDPLRPSKHFINRWF